MARPTMAAALLLTLASRYFVTAPSLVLSGLSCEDLDRHGKPQANAEQSRESASYHFTRVHGDGFACESYPHGGGVIRPRSVEPSILDELAAIGGSLSALPQSIGPAFVAPLSLVLPCVAPVSAPRHGAYSPAGDLVTYQKASDVFRMLGGLLCDPDTLGPDGNGNVGDAEGLPSTLLQIWTVLRHAYSRGRGATLLHAGCPAAVFGGSVR